MPASSSVRRGVHRAQGVQGLTRGDREAELLVLVGGGDVLVGVRLDPGGDPHHDPRPLAESAGGDQPPDALDLVEGVRDDPTDAGVQRQLQLGFALVVAVQTDRARIDPGPQSHGQLAPGAHVDAEALLGDPAGDGSAQEGLARVVDVPAGEGRGEVPGPGAQVVLVEHVDRRTDLLGDLGDGQSGDREHALGVLADVAAPQRRQQLVDVGGHPQPARRPAQDVGVDRARDMHVGHRHTLSERATPGRMRPAPGPGVGWSQLTGCDSRATSGHGPPLDLDRTRLPGDIRTPSAPTPPTPRPDVTPGWCPGCCRATSRVRGGPPTTDTVLLGPDAGPP